VNRAGPITALLLALLVSPAATQPAARGETTAHPLKGVWFPWEPYEYVRPEEPLAGPTGLDIELVSTIIEGLGQDIVFHREPSRAQHLAVIQTGAADFSTSPRTLERERYAFFSDPLRREINVLYVRRGQRGRYRNQGVEQMLRTFSERRFRLGVVSGFDYGPDALREYIRSHEDTPLILKAADVDTLFRALTRGTIDGFIIDRLAGATRAWRAGSQARFDVLPMPAECSYEICLMFSRQTTSLVLVEAVNRGLRELKRDGRYDAIVRRYALPVLLSITIGREWFFVVDILGTIAFALSGVILARKDRFDLVGALVLAALPAVGGGILRDLIVNREPPGVMRTPAYLLAVIITVLAGYLTFKFLALRHEHLILGVFGGDGAEQRSAAIATRAFQVLDTLGLAAFTVIGVVVAAESRAAPLVLWGPILAAMTSSGGGILRDMVRADPHTGVLKTSFYPEVSLIWGLLFAVFLNWQTGRLNPDEVFLGVMVIFLGAFLTRLAAIRFRLKPLSF